MSRFRLTSALLAVVLAWMAAVPVLAVTCVPGHECPMGAAMGAHAAAGMVAGCSAVASSTDCCLRSERRSESGTVQRPLVLQVDQVELLARATDLEPKSTDSSRHQAPQRHLAGQVPLYTLHSILLI